jgi:hypothetical protein
MNKPFNTPTTSLRKAQIKDKQIKCQIEKVFDGFFKEPQSMKMLSIKLNIDRANICWNCREFKKENKIGIAKKGICSVTKYNVNFYTTNPKLFPKSYQTKLF